MEFTGQPVTLPLQYEINRCLAHGDRPGEWCERRYQCAAHETIKHDGGIRVPTAYRKCMTDAYAAYLPMVGFQPEWGVE